ncbi:unnamed protein product, partial [marine sediment metagenome]
MNTRKVNSDAVRGVTMTLDECIQRLKKKLSERGGGGKGVRTLTRRGTGTGTGRGGIEGDEDTSPEEEGMSIIDYHG